jgi:hypothetical protein
MKIKIDKYMKIRLLKACAAGEMNVDDFPELFNVAPKNVKLMTDEELDAQIKELERKNKMIDQ